MKRSMNGALTISSIVRTMMSTTSGEELRTATSSAMPMAIVEYRANLRDTMAAIGEFGSTT